MTKKFRCPKCNRVMTKNVFYSCPAPIKSLSNWNEKVDECDQYDIEA